MRGYSSIPFSINCFTILLLISSTSTISYTFGTIPKVYASKLFGLQQKSKLGQHALIVPRRGGSSGEQNELLRNTKLHATTSTKEDEVKAIVTNYVSEANLALLSERGQKAITNLIMHDYELKAQQHVYANWPEPGVDDDGKRRLSEQVRSRLYFIINKRFFDYPVRRYATT